MFFQNFLKAFTTVFVAELGDKTQIATLSLAAAASGASGKWAVFAGASIALIANVAIGVLLGEAVSRYISPRHIEVAAGIIFIVLGVLYISGKA